jgi:hypothetical protein
MKLIIGTALVFLAVPITVEAQSTPLYRVFLADGSALSSFGEWARVDDRVVFSMPVTPGAGPSDLHLVSLPVQRIDLSRTERYAHAVRASHYAASRGEADFAQLSGQVAQALNEVALINHPVARLAAAERARAALADWPATHYGYRAADVRQILGVLDEVISGLRASAGQGRFDLTLTATTAEPPMEPLLGAPDERELVQQLVTASTVVSTSTERVSLLQSVLALIDRAVDVLPAAFAASVRSTALGGIAEEQRIDALYHRLRAATLTDAARYAERADVRGLERVRRQLQEHDVKLNSRRPDDIAALAATLDAHLNDAHRLRLAHDQWLLRVDRLRAYQRDALPYVRALAAARGGLDDIRAMAGPAPQQLKSLASHLSRDGRRFALIEPPAEIAAVHAVFRSAYSLAENAVQLRMDAARAADVDLAQRAAAAASGALMLLGRGRADLDRALQPPIAARSTAQK